MDYYVERLNQELTKIIRFWNQHAIQNERFATQVDSQGNKSFSEPLGSLFIARVLYGSSAAERFSNDISSQELSDLSYRTLRNQLSNPNGGYYWTVNEYGEILHDERHVSFVQAFVLYGLSEYYALTSDPEVKREMFNQIDFIENKIKNTQDNSYVDGFDQDWNPLPDQKRSLGTHLHMLEAYTKFIEVTGDLIYLRRVENLLDILLNHFVDLKEGLVYQLFDDKWKLQSNENWIGHNLEAAWIILQAARLVKKSEYLDKSINALIILSENAIEKGFDTKYGGMINRFVGEEALSTDKEWWPQAEAVIAFLHSYRQNQDKKFLSYAIRLLEYIDNTFSDHVNGEWYESVSREGKPLPNQMKLHLWKSMYHNVRYCIETMRQLEALFIQVA